MLARRSLADGLPMTRGRGVNVTRRLAELLPAGAKVGEGGTPRRSDLRPVPHPHARGLTTRLTGWPQSALTRLPEEHAARRRALGQTPVDYDEVVGPRPDLDEPA